MQRYKRQSMEKKELRVFHSDPLDYHSILDALKGCCALFYSFELPSDHPTYDEFMGELEVRAAHNVLEACAQTDTIDKVVFTSSATGGSTTPTSVLPSTSAGMSTEEWTEISAAVYFELKQAFEMIDRDGDGKITKEELESLLSRLGAEPPSKEELRQMLSEVDRDGDGG